MLRYLLSLGVPWRSKSDGRSRFAMIVRNGLPLRRVHLVQIALHTCTICWCSCSLALVSNSCTQTLPPKSSHTLHTRTCSRVNSPIGLCNRFEPNLVCTDCGVPQPSPVPLQRNVFYGACTSCWQELLGYEDAIARRATTMEQPPGRAK